LSDAPDQRPDPQVLVLFGATGDLAARKLFPGLYRLGREGLLPEEFRVIGSGRHSPGDDDEFREHVKDVIKEHGDEDEPDADSLDAFAKRVSFTVSSAEDGDDLAAAVKSAEEELGEDVERLVYLSVPPSAMQDMIGMLGKSGIAEGARLIVEKPFGTDLESAKELNATLHEVVGEDQVFRIDHFLGKEAAQNILVLRFANGLFEPAWNREHIAYVQIDVPEDLDIEGRAGFYESTGAFRDMISTHLFQLLGFVALEPPVHLDADALHVEKKKVFDAVQPIDPDRVVFGQYEGYREEEDVDPDSQVETFVAMEVRVDTWRWSHVPFFLRTGKAMAEGRRTITIGFREPPLHMFQTAGGSDAEVPNELVFELSDDAEVTIDVRAKQPGPTLEIGDARWRLDVAEAFDGHSALEAYERLLHDVMRGDHTLFTRADEVERLWELCDPVLESRPEVHPYEKGSWGPEAAIELTGRRGWRLPDGDS
jgi:glucose-6-phosphate 1-dehydrogenase